MFSGSVDSFPSPYNSSFDTPQNACSFDIRKDVENIQNERLRLANEELREALFLSDGKKSEIQETESNNADNCLDYSHVSQDPRYTFSKKEGYSTDSSDQMTDSTSSSKIEDTSPISRTKNGEYLRPNSDKLASSNDLLNILKGDGSKSVSFLSARLPASRSGSIQMVSPEPGTLKSILKRSPGLSSTDTETSSPETAARQRRSLRHEGFERETRERGSGDHWQQQDLQQREKRTQESSLVGSQCFDRDYRAVNEADLRELEKRVKGHKRPHKGHWASSSDDEDRKYGTDSSRRKEFGSSRDMETKLTELNSRLDYRSASDKRISVSSSGEEERQRGKTLSDSRDLLKMLGASPLSFESQQREQQSSASAARKSKDKKAIELDEVLVWGRHKPKYFTTIENLQIPIQLRSAVKGEKVFEASPLQAYLWPAISRGRDVVGIASSGRGKTIGCLIPVLTVLVESEDYADLPMGNGVSYVVCRQSVLCVILQRFPFDYSVEVRVMRRQHISNILVDLSHG